MDRHGIESLAQFCIAQRKAFDPHAWYARLEADGASLALAAKYLSMTSWYGHEEELEEIAARTQAFVDSSAGLHRESRAIDFDLPYFSAKVRIGLAVLQQRPRHERRRQRLVPSEAQGDTYEWVRLPLAG